LSSIDDAIRLYEELVIDYPPETSPDLAHAGWCLVFNRSELTANRRELDYARAVLSKYRRQLKADRFKQEEEIEPVPRLPVDTLARIRESVQVIKDSLSEDDGFFFYRLRSGQKVTDPRDIAIHLSVHTDLIVTGSMVVDAIKQLRVAREI